MQLQESTPLVTILETRKPSGSCEWEALQHVACKERFSKSNKTLGWLIESTRVDMKPIACGARHAFQYSRVQKCATRERNLLCKHPEVTRKWLECRIELAGWLGQLTEKAPVFEYREAIHAATLTQEIWSRHYSKYKNDILRMFSGFTINNDNMNAALRYITTAIEEEPTERHQLQEMTKEALRFLMFFDDGCHTAAELGLGMQQSVVQKVEHAFTPVMHTIQQRILLAFESMVGQSI